MANTSIAEIPGISYAAGKAIIGAQRALARVSAFTTNFSDETVNSIGDALVVKVFKGGEASVFNVDTNDYETTDGTMEQVTIKFDTHLKHTFSFTDEEASKFNTTGIWADAGKTAGKVLARGIEKFVTQKITAEAISATHTLGTVSKTNIAKLRKKCAEVGADTADSVLLLAPDQFADLLALLDTNVYGGAEAIQKGKIDGLYGFKAVMEGSQLPAGTIGAVIPETAIVVASRQVPVNCKGNYEEVGSIVDENSGLVLGMRRHGAPAKGKNFATLEVLMGCALVQPDKCIRLVTSA
jgi:hypothetical protein